MRLRPLENVRAAGIGVCCGGIVGMGEGVTDRAAMLQILANHAPHPESVPINALVAVPGTPLEEQPAIDPFDLVRRGATWGCSRHDFKRETRRSRSRGWASGGAPVYEAAIPG